MQKYIHLVSTEKVGACAYRNSQQRLTNELDFASRQGGLAVTVN